MSEQNNSTFNNRVYGCVIVKSINSNYNADFTHQPRTLPDGIVYATDKALKYTIKHYLLKNYPSEKIFFYKRLNENMNPLSLDESYTSMFGDYKKDKTKSKKDETKETINKSDILNNLLTCLDIKLFGATFAGETNISIHGTVQINHGVNCYPENIIFSEQIMSPFRNPGEADSVEKEAATLGSQSKLREGHYVHHFSINPNNLVDHFERINKDSTEIKSLTMEDIKKLQEGMRKGATYYDSASKAGTENELLLWIQLKKNSQIVLPNFTELIDIRRNNGLVEIDINKISQILNNDNYKNEIEKVELFYNKITTIVQNTPPKIIISEL